MTIPSRPAPAPPGSRGLNAAAGANASLDQLRQQLQQQQQQHSQQNGGVQKLTIKLPPPPNARMPNGGTPLGNSFQQKSNNNINYNFNNTNGCNGTSITRKFPQANVRYAPATSWDGLPFEPTGTSSATNGNYKKVPPPRPPPPKLQGNTYTKKSAAPVPPQSVNILNNIFNRKKTTKAPVPNRTGRLTPAAVYGTSSGTFSSTTTSSSSSQSNSTCYGSTTNFNNWGSSNAFSSLTTTTTSTSTIYHQEPQLISFDSPPSSPTFTQKSNSDCVSVDSFSSDSNFSSPNNGSVSQPESGFEDDFIAGSRSTTSPLDPWETLEAFGSNTDSTNYCSATGASIGTAPVRNLNSINSRIQTFSDNPLCNGKSLLPPAPSLTAPTIIKPKISQKPKAPKPPALNKRFSNTNTSSAYGSNQLITPPSPPMPQCSPPPPPSSNPSISLLDVISGKVDALHLDPNVCSDFEESGPPYGIALYNFEGLEDGDLCFRENEKIYLLEQVSDEWYRGRSRSGCEGIFPVNYVEIKIPLAAHRAVETPPTKNVNSFTMQGTQTASSSSYAISKVKCLYNFPAEVDGDLPLRENDLVTVLYKINDDWFYGEIDNRQGQFPANFLEYVPANVPMP